MSKIDEVMKAWQEDHQKVSWQDLQTLKAENDTLRAQLSEKSIGQGVPDGWQLVPKEPTQQMFDAGEDTFECAYTGTPTSSPARVWSAMLTSAPPAPQSSQQKPLLFSEIWDNDAIMEVNADARLPFEMIERFVRAIEAAATEPLLQRIAELEDSLSAWRRNAELADQANREIERELEKEKQYVKEMTKDRDHWMTVAAERALLLDKNRKVSKPLSSYEFDEIG